MISWSDKRYWYFITQENMGHTMWLNPRTPSNMSDREPMLKRICVAPTVAHCASAITLYDGGGLFMYRTNRRVKARETYDVDDACITKEHWLMSRTKFKLVKHIECLPPKGWYYGERGDFESLKNQRKDKRASIKFFERIDKRLAHVSLSDVAWQCEESVERLMTFSEIQKKRGF